MPGIIKVSVLNFYRSVSGNSVKVSLGSREFQAVDDSEFSFPLTSLRDSVIVSLLDKDGNTLSSEEVQTRVVIQKTVWGKTLFFNGRGYVHIKMEFLLSDEDRERIRLMRNMAAKKKRDELLNKSKHVEIPAVESVKILAPQTEKIFPAIENGVEGIENGVEGKEEDDVSTKPEIVTDDSESSDYEEEEDEVIAYYNDEAKFYGGESLFSSGWVFTDEGMGLCFTTAMNNALMKCTEDWEFCLDRDLCTGEVFCGAGYGEANLFIWLNCLQGNCEIEEFIQSKDRNFEVQQPFKKAVEVAIMVGFAVLIVFT